MRVPLKNRFQAAPESHGAAWTIPSQQWQTGKPNPFESRYGGSNLDLVVPAACIIGIEMGCSCCLLSKWWGPSSPIQVDEILSVDVSDYRSSLQCGGTNVGSTPRP
ncbi:uncharacterized protein DS421_20g690140 [Arachis hypogaea]|nr:uncharacterized protein DS421_20g690140 [Arachis hypogaea]